MTGVLQTANLGDSGFLLVRNREVIKRSQKQTHTFNTPKVRNMTKSEKNEGIETQSFSQKVEGDE